MKFALKPLIIKPYYSANTTLPRNDTTMLLINNIQQTTKYNYPPIIIHGSCGVAFAWANERHHSSSNLRCTKPSNSLDDRSVSTLDVQNA